MKNLFKQKIFYIGLACLLVAVAMAVLQSVTTDSNKLLAKYEAGMNKGDVKKLTSLMLPENAALYQGLGALNEAFGGTADEMLEAFGVDAKQLKERAPKYLYMPARTYVDANGAKKIYYFALPIKGMEDSVSYQSMNVEKIEGKEYLDF